MASDPDEIETNKIHRRTKSVTRAEEITTKNQKQRQSQPDKPYVFDDPLFHIDFISTTYSIHLGTIYYVRWKNVFIMKYIVNSLKKNPKIRVIHF